MAGKYVRLLDAQVIGANEKQARDQVLDLGGYKQLNIQARILKAGTLGSVFIEDAAVNEEAAFTRTIASFSVVTPTNPIEVNGFLRFVRWRADANVAGGPAMLIDIVAKE